MNLLSVAPKLTPYDCRNVRLLTTAHDNRKYERPLHFGWKEGAVNAADIALYNKRQVIEAIEYWIKMGDSTYVEEREALLKKLK